MKKNFKLLLFFTITLSLFSTGCVTTSKNTTHQIVQHQYKDFNCSDYYHYKAELNHEGRDVTPAQAYEMVLADPEHTFIIDARTPAEYAFIGHPTGSYNIPLKFSTNEIEEKERHLTPKMTANNNFGKDLLAKFNTSTDTLIFMCRSGKRSCMACDEAIKVGFSKEKLFSLLGGFEGGKIENKNSAFYGQRKAGGWVNEGLPWDYKLDANLAYMPSK